MVIIFISSRRAVLRRFAALCIASQCNSTICLLHRVAALRVAALRSASPRRATQLNSTICFSLRSATRCSALQHVSPLCCATLLNDLFVTTQRTPQLGSRHLNDSQRDFAYCDAPLRSSTQRFVCCFAALLFATPLDLPQRTSAQLNDLFVITQRTTAPRRAPRLDTTLGNDLFVISRRNATQRSAPWVSAALLNATICLLRRILTLRTATRVTATQRNHLFVTMLRFASLRYSRQLVWPRRAAAHCISPQLNDLFVTSLLGASLRASSLCCTACRITPRRNSSQRTETLKRKTNVQTFETNFGNV